MHGRPIIFQRALKIAFPSRSVSLFIHRRWPAGPWLRVEKASGAEEIRPVVERCGAAARCYVLTHRCEPPPSMPGPPRRRTRRQRQPPGRGGIQRWGRRGATRSRTLGSTRPQLQPTATARSQGCRGLTTPSRKHAAKSVTAETPGSSQPGLASTRALPSPSVSAKDQPDCCRPVSHRLLHLRALWTPWWKAAAYPE
jgi:hypothetical protein